MKLAKMLSGIVLIGIMSCASFDKKILSHHIKTLASDEFDGRAPMSLGEEKTLRYLEHEFRKMGAKTLPHWTSFRQAVPIARIKTDVIGPVTLSGLNLLPHEEIVITSEALKENLNLNKIPVIFAGYGITAPEFAWDDYKNLDVKGKIVVTLVGDPGFMSPELFNGKDVTYYGRWTYKHEEALRRGARGIFVIHETDAAGYGFHVVQHKESQLKLNNNQSGLEIQGWLSLDAAKKIFRKAGFDFDDMKKKAIYSNLNEVKLGLINININNHIAFGESYNICGYIEGKNNKEYTALSAHWDHFGSKLNSEGLREIYRGAIDNATGVSALLELGRYFSRHKPPKNLLLCSFTAEEQGLLGAKYFVEQEKNILNSIVAMLNFDCLNVGEKSQPVISYGPTNNKLYPLIKAEAAKQARSLIKDPNGEKGYYFRSDHFPFAQVGVDVALFMDIGVSNPNYLLHNYHRPSDAHDEKWPLSGMVEDLAMFKNIILRL